MAPFEYREILPAPRFAHGIECYWTLLVLADFKHTVYPDGCTDLLLRGGSNSGKRLHVIGTMTQAQVVEVSKGEAFLGVRFLPGMVASLLPGYSHAFSDAEISSQEFMSPQNLRLVRSIWQSDSVEEQIALMESFWRADAEPTATQQAILRILASGGSATMEEVCDVAGLGERQFRRACNQLTGVPPKLLGRILRFRQTRESLQSSLTVDFARLAADNKYFDQAHMGHEFRHFAGHSPSRPRCG